MAKNQKTVTENIVKAKAGLAEGKSVREVAKDVGVSKSYVHKIGKEGGQEWTEVKKSSFIQDIIDKSFGNVDLATEIELKFLNQLRDKDELTAQDSNVASQIGERNQKRGSVLAGENTDDKGGERKIEIINYKDA